MACLLYWAESVEFSVSVRNWALRLSEDIGLLMDTRALLLVGGISLSLYLSREILYLFSWPALSCVRGKSYTSSGSFFSSEL
jgi:hypothetical protein